MKMSRETRKKIVSAVYSLSELYGCEIYFHSHSDTSVISEGYIPSKNYGRIVVILEEIGNHQIHASSSSIPKEPTAFPFQQVFNSSVYMEELKNLGLNLGLTVVSYAGIVGGVAAEIPTGGVSTVLIVASWTGFVTGALQTFNSATRVAKMFMDSPASLKEWDENKTYSTTKDIVDGLGTLSSLVSVPYAMRNLLAILARKNSMITIQKLSQMSVAERKVAIKSAVKQATRTPEGRAEVEKALVEAGLTNKQSIKALAHGATTTKRAKKVFSAINKVSSKRLTMALADVISGGIGLAVSDTLNGKNGLLIHVLVCKDLIDGSSDAEYSTFKGYMD